MKSFWVKATTRQSGLPKRSLSWLTARSDWFQAFSDRIECGDWVVPSSDVRRAILYIGGDFLIPGKVLELQTSDKTYQFGFNPWVDLRRHLPFEVEERRLQVRPSTLTIVARLAVVLALIHLLLLILTRLL